MLIDNCTPTGSTRTIIKTFKHKGLKTFYERGSKAGIQATQASKLERILDRLNQARHPEDMRLPSFDFHELHGDEKGTYSVSVNGNWRVTFSFVQGDAYAVDYKDYH